VRLWRLARAPYVALDGAGGLYGASRWNSRGRPIIYCGEAVTSALVEVLVHLEIDPEDMPEYRLLTIDLPDDLPIDAVEVASLPATWRQQPEVTRTIGDKWLAEANFPILRVPSAIAPHTWNVLLNPLHPLLAGLVATSDEPLEFDSRLL
jgi:RES domain-containing protein